MSDRLRELDNRMIGKSVPDDRPRSERLLRPRAAVWSGRGRLLYGATLIGMLAVLRWVSDPLIEGLAFVALFAVAGLLSFADERKRSRRFRRRRRRRRGAGPS
jgi:hypothetical protein